MANLPQVVDVTLAPGEFYFGGGYTRVHTLLGSCVAITMWHPQKQIGGMCHYLLPSRGLKQRLTKGHYADEAIKLFLQAIFKAHTRPQEYEVKLFGGGHMLQTYAEHNAGRSISHNNIISGLELLEQYGLSVKARDVGGAGHRKIFLELWNGDVWVQRGQLSGGEQT